MREVSPFGSDATTLLSRAYRLGRYRVHSVAFCLGVSIAISPAVQAKADIIQLSCAGKLNKGLSSDEPWMLSLAIDTDNRTVTVNNYDPLSFTGDDATLIAFLGHPAASEGVITGTLNRITGDAGINIIDKNLAEGLLMFRGVCNRVTIEFVRP